MPITNKVSFFIWFVFMISRFQISRFQDCDGQKYDNLVEWLIFFLTILSPFQYFFVSLQCQMQIWRMADIMERR